MADASTAEQEFVFDVLDQLQVELVNLETYEIVELIHLAQRTLTYGDLAAREKERDDITARILTRRTSSSMGVIEEILDTGALPS